MSSNTNTEAIEKSLIRANAALKSARILTRPKVTVPSNFFQNPNSSRGSTLANSVFRRNTKPFGWPLKSPVGNKSRKGKGRKSKSKSRKAKKN
jgi:hypothetical protein